MQANGDGEFTFGPWGYVASTINNQILLQNELTGWRLEYRVKAVNKGGESSPSNTVCVML
jgi:hypothetical protein